MGRGEGRGLISASVAPHCGDTGGEDRGGEAGRGEGGYFNRYTTDET